jgi:hypothetical protein
MASIENRSPFGSATIGVERTGGLAGKYSLKSAFSVAKASASAMKHVTRTTCSIPLPASSRTARRFSNAAFNNLFQDCHLLSLRLHSYLGRGNSIPFFWIAALARSDARNAMSRLDASRFFEPTTTAAVNTETY